MHEDLYAPPVLPLYQFCVVRIAPRRSASSSTTRAEVGLKRIRRRAIPYFTSFVPIGRIGLFRFGLCRRAKQRDRTPHVRPSCSMTELSYGRQSLPPFGYVQKSVRRRDREAGSGRTSFVPIDRPAYSWHFRSDPDLDRGGSWKSQTAGSPRTYSS